MAKDRPPFVEWATKIDSPAVKTTNTVPSGPTVMSGFVAWCSGLSGLGAENVRPWSVDRANRSRSWGKPPGVGGAISTQAV